jgi:hypothetical protein
LGSVKDQIFNQDPRVKFVILIVSDGAFVHRRVPVLRREYH